MLFRQIGVCVVALAALIAVIGFAPAGRLPAAALDPNLRMPPAVSRVVSRACADCHSGATRWPWYSRIPPVSWLIHGDVTTGRKAMDLSNWTKTAGRNPRLTIGVLAAACGDVQSERMPLGQYLFLHPSARLSADEKAQFCQWTREQIAHAAMLNSSQSSTAATSE